MTIWDLDTPSLLIDLDRMEANLDRAADYASKHGLCLRPHTKTHKSPLVAGMQLDRKAVGLTVAKVGEAEVMATDRVPSLLVAYPIWGDTKWERLIEVAKRVPVTVALDSRECAEGIHRYASRAGVEVGILLEADLGMERCGVPPSKHLVALGNAISNLSWLRLDGILFYPGHVSPAVEGSERKMLHLQRDVERLLQRFRRADLPTKIVSGGSTPTLYHSHRVRGMTEIRPGTYVFNDCMQVAAGSCTWHDCAATVMTTVVSVSEGGRAVVDGGSKTFTSDTIGADGDTTYGRVVGMPAARFHRMSEEHGMLDLTACPGPRPRIGQRMRIIPNHVCVTVNMHEMAHGIRGETVERSWPVAARGKIQ